MKKVPIFIVRFGFYHVPNAEHDYSYWDYDIAWKTFQTYQAMVPDWISIETYYIPE